jgi:hypothetical protein
MMAVAKMHRQRKVTRSRWGPRFSKQRRAWRGTSTFGLPTITSISPDTAAHGEGEPPLTMVVTGTGFVPGITLIVWNGVDEPTTYISPTQCSTGVQPATASGPAVIPVKVRNANLLSVGSQDFTIT